MIMQFIQRLSMTLKISQQRTSYNLNLVLLIWTLALLILFSSIPEIGGSDLSCHKLKAVLESRKFMDNQFSRESMGGGHLRICAKDSRTCCHEETEKFLLAESRKEYNKAIATAINQLSSVINSKSKRFDSFFKNLLTESKRDFDKMFKKTYGIIYEQNSYVFTDLFEELERYYINGQVDLEEAMENFFNTLYQKMFTVLNAQYQFDDKYLVCIGDHMKDLKPFGDVPQKLSVQIKRSFVATRTFAQSLNSVKDVVDRMQELGAAGDCNQALLRMSYCQACKGMPEIKPCNNFCTNVLKGCLAYHSDLDTEWNNFVDAMDKVSERLLGPFNIEVVVEPINIKISEAIMNFQENAHDVSEKVFSGCGRLPLGRRTRDTRELELETYQFTREDAKQQQQHQPSLEKLIRDIRQKLRDSKSFWVNLPYQICNDDKVAASTKDASCWNGTAPAKYTRKITPNGLHNQHSNPEVSIETSRPKSLLNEQIYNLRTVTSRLRSAYDGLDVNWIDIEEDISSVDTGSGAGAVAGSGDGRIEEPEPEPEHEGSGGGHHPNRDYDDTEDDDDDDEDGERQHIPQPPKHPVSSNDESNVIPKNSDDLMTRSGTNVYSSNSSPDIRSQITLMKAVASYLFPICVVWLGGILSDWL